MILRMNLRLCRVCEFDDIERSQIMTEVKADMLLELTADVVAAHVSNNSVSLSDVPTLIQSVYSALSAPLASSQAVVVDERQPAVSVRASVKKDHIVCLDCGKKCKTLRRHIHTAHGLEPEDYRERWNLPKDYPFVAPEYSERRADMAREIGLGRGGRGGAKAGKRK